MAQILLTNGLTTLVDEDDFYWLNQWKWHAATTGSKTYAVRSRRNNHLKLSSRAYIHRIVMRVEDPELFVDHINGDSLDNRKENLRLCTSIQNTYNKKGKDNTSSKYKGVSYDKSRDKWVAQIRVSKRKRLSKRFNTELDAALWYDEQAIIHHKEFAYTNIKNK